MSSVIEAVSYLLSVDKRNFYLMYAVVLIPLTVLYLELLYSIIVGQSAIGSKYKNINQKPIYRFYVYMNGIQTNHDHLSDKEIEHVIKKRLYNPRITNPHFPWNGDNPPIGLHNGQ